MQHPGSPCRPDGPILILTLDSFHKIREGEERGYDPSSSMPDAGIPAACREFLMAARAEVYRRLMNGEVVWEDSQREMGINRHLKAGRDLGGSDPSARYLPALHRYDGHFFDGLGEQGKAEFRQSRHHLLILSALYGFVRPFEPVQYYTCQFGEKNVSYGIWAEKNGISKVLAEYIRAHCIRRVFDFTACDVPAYHEIIDWEYVFRETGADVLHCYHRLTGTDKALKFFGIFVRRRMLPASPEELLAMQPGAVIDDILFSGMRLLKKSDPGAADDETLLALIMGGENESVEFKTSALWSRDYTQEQIQQGEGREIRRYGKSTSKFMIARAVAAFLNTDGGDLIIGVRERKYRQENEIFGIDGEFEKLQDPGTDGYRRMIVGEIFRKYFPPDIYNHLGQYVQISFQRIHGKTVCRVQVGKSDIPVFISAGSDELFFIRVDAETREITGRELADYILKRFASAAQG